MKQKLHFIYSAVLVAQLIGSPLFLEGATKKSDVEKQSDGYTINFDNVPIQEFLKFISKIAGVNVIYNEPDLNFNISIVSEDPTDLNNILSALVQVLRINGLTLIEEDQNLLIHKNDGVKQIPTVVSMENPLKTKIKPPIMTKVFKIQNGNPSHIASLIVPMLSRDALVEVSTETRQLIITDVSSSVLTVEQLLLSLDAPETPYDVDAYSIKYAQANDLATLARKILSPIADATTLEIIPQPNTQTIYVVSTPFLIDKTLAILQDLDKQEILATPKNQIKQLMADNVLVYKIQHKTPEDIEVDLKKMVDAATSQKFTSEGLNIALGNMKYIKSTNSFMLIGDPQDLTILESFLKSIDSTNAPAIQHSSFFVYNIKNATEEQLRSSLTNLAEYLTSGKNPNISLVQAIGSMRWIKATNSLLFTGHAGALKELSEILPSFDVAPEKSKINLTQTPLSSEFLIYNPKQMNAAYLKGLILETANNLKSAELADPAFLKTLQSVKELPSSNQLIFTGDKNSLDRLMAVLQTLDQKSSGASQEGPYFVPLKYTQVDSVKRALATLSADLPKDNPIVKMIDSMDYLPESKVLIFNGPRDAFLRIQEVIQLTDTSESSAAIGSQVSFFHIQNRPAKDIVTLLRETATKLASGPNPPSSLIQTLDSAQWMVNSNTVIVSGNSENLARVKDLITANDVQITKNSGSMKSGKEVVFIPTLHRPAKEIVTLLRETADALAKTGSSDADLIHTLKTADATPNGNTIILSGTPVSIRKAEELISANDVSAQNYTQMSPGSEITFVPIVNRSAKEIALLLRETANTLTQSGSTDINLIQTLKTADATPNGNTVILSGTPQSLQKAGELISANDIMQKHVQSELFVYKLRYLSTDDLKLALSGIADHADETSPSTDTDALMRTINTMRVIPDSGAVQFVAPPHIIAQLKDILLILDIPENARSQVKQQFGSNFLVYKIQYANPNDLLSHLKQLVKDAPNQDSLMKTVAGAQYSSSSNSLVFTGTKSDLDKIQVLLQNLDEGKPSLPPVTPTRQAETYKTYKPSYVTGQELIQMIQNFEQRLVASGVTDANFAEVVDHLSYLERTNTLILTGKEVDIDQVLNLLKEFDTQENASGKTGKQFESGLETIDDTGFLIYKLQHQSGAGLVQALTVISSDLGNQTSQKKNTGLIEAIRSTQWVEPTNSLIATGQPRVLTKLRELIESIDQPLKQVFIEILVIESNNNDDLEFGLSWGSQGAVHNRFSWGTGNYNTNDTNDNSTVGAGFPTGLNGITSSTLPTGQDIPPVLGGFLGVIGDVIWHKGKSYASLGSLLKAFRTVATITEVLSQKIVAQDNQNAKVFSGSNIPFTGSLVTTSGLSQTTNANLEYRNVGVTLSITPIIGDNDIITLDIDYELSEEANQGTGSGSNVSTAQANNINGITTTKTSMQTKVHMPDRHFLVLSGTMQNTSSRLNNGIPCLGGLPLIGAAFSLNQKLTTTQNVIIFVKPHIIKSEQIYGRITREQEEIFGNSDQTNVEDFQNGLELIRSADDIDDEDTE